jgi:hypothetical protein
VVALEGLSRRVRLVTVELDDELLRAPGEVGLVAVDRDVRQWPGQVLGVEEGEEAAFEAASEVRLDDAALIDEPSDVGRALAPWVPRDQGFEGGRAREPERLRALGGAGELVLGGDRGEVKEGAGGGW